jgi:drug/metabolite transporter (DMT)-like permease
LLIGCVGLMLIMRWRGLALPRKWQVWRHLLVIGLINVAIPFALITWAESGEQGLDSGVASILNSTVPLFSIIIAGYLWRMERVTGGKILGLLVGFAGVLILLSRNGSGEWDNLLPALAVTVAAACYAAGSVYARRKLQEIRPVVLAAGQLLVAATIITLAALLLEDWSRQSFPPMTVLALLWLGIMGSCLAYIFYFTVLQAWGATRTTLVTYLIPVVGVTAGVLFLGEELHWQVIVGGLLILSGVGTVNLQKDVKRPRDARSRPGNVSAS